MNIDDDWQITNTSKSQNEETGENNESSNSCDVISENMTVEDNKKEFKQEVDVDLSEKNSTDQVIIVDDKEQKSPEENLFSESQESCGTPIISSVNDESETNIIVRNIQKRFNSFPKTIVRRPCRRTRCRSVELPIPHFTRGDIIMPLQSSSNITSTEISLPLPQKVFSTEKNRRRSSESLNSLDNDENSCSVSVRTKASSPKEANSESQEASNREQDKRDVNVEDLVLVDKSIGVSEKDSDQLVADTQVPNIEYEYEIQKSPSEIVMDYCNMYDDILTYEEVVGLAENHVPDSANSKTNLLQPNSEAEDVTQSPRSNASEVLHLCKTPEKEQVRKTFEKNNINNMNKSNICSENRSTCSNEIVNSRKSNNQKRQSKRSQNIFKNWDEAINPTKQDYLSTKSKRRKSKKKLSSANENDINSKKNKCKRKIIVKDLSERMKKKKLPTSEKVEGEKENNKKPIKAVVEETSIKQSQNMVFNTLESCQRAVVRLQRMPVFKIKIATGRPDAIYLNPKQSKSKQVLSEMVKKDLDSNLKYVNDVFGIVSFKPMTKTHYTLKFTIKKDINIANHLETLYIVKKSKKSPNGFTWFPKKIFDDVVLNGRKMKSEDKPYSFLLWSVFPGTNILDLFTNNQISEDKIILFGSRISSKSSSKIC